MTRFTELRESVRGYKERNEYAKVKVTGLKVGRMISTTQNH